MTESEFYELEAKLVTARSLMQQIEEMNRRLALLERCPVLGISEDGIYLFGSGSVGGLIQSVSVDVEMAPSFFANARLVLADSLTRKVSELRCQFEEL